MIIFLNKLPIPNLKHYCIFSFGLLGLVVLYSQKILRDLKNDNYKSDKFDYVNSIETSGYLFTTYKAITNEPWCLWVLINFCYCGLMLFSKVIQIFIFGKLRAVENQHIKDQFWNFIFLKFIFIFGVLNLENVNEVIMWCTWFSIIGFLSIHCQICKDRYEYLSFSASTPLKNHIKVLFLLVSIQLVCFTLIGVSFINSRTYGFSVGLFMFAESIGLTLRTLYVIIRYGVHLWDLHTTTQWNNKGTITYYIDFVFEMSVITIDFLHYLYMLVYDNFYLSMASLVICMELKRLFFDLKGRMKRHSNYLKVIEKMEKRFPWATQEELENSDKCAVCWDVLDKARRLPCSHIFHHNCLRSWLEQDTSCPTCRKSLQDEKELQAQQHPAALNRVSLLDQQPQVQQPGQPNENQQAARPQVVRHRNLFHFNGSRYASWLPSFSLQVTNGAIPGFLGSAGATIEPERLNQMTQQITQLFPHIPIDLIQQDLRQTHSVDLTVENILEDRLNANNNTNNNNNNNLRRNLLNSLNDDSDFNGEFDDDEDDSSSDDDSNDNQIGASNNQSNSDTSRSAVRRRNNLFTSLLMGASTSTAATAQNQPTSSLNNQEQDIQIQNSVNSNVLDDSPIIHKYSPSSSLSENANTLIQRKRDLVLSSKKRYLEKVNSSLQAKQSSSNVE